jgi:hypothetical protein
MIGGVAPLVRIEPSPDGSLDDLRSRLTALEAALGDRLRQAGQLRADLGAFRLRYRQEVGRLHDQLDDLERAIAEAELGELAAQMAERAGDPAAAPSTAPPEPPPRFTSDAVRRLFRDVAKAIHPDLARDAVARDRRHALMIEANRAYALGDEERLRDVLQAWENSPEAVEGSDPDAARARLVRRIAQFESQLDTADRELAALHDSPLAKLKVMVDEAAGRGKDLVRDMVRRLERDILVARNRLDAIQSLP